jgi:acyl carrier protein
MGLDSVELLMYIEQYFDIRIPDTEAEKIGTVQDMADAVALRRQVIPGPDLLREQVFSKINNYIKSEYHLTEELQLSSFIAPYLPTADSPHWQFLEKAIQLEIPRPHVLKSPRRSAGERLKRWMGLEPSYTWNAVTTGEFSDAICARNYKTLTDPRNVISRYEIYITLMAIIVQQIGVDYYDITPEKSFTDDLGID